MTSSTTIELFICNGVEYTEFPRDGKILYIRDGIKMARTDYTDGERNGHHTVYAPDGRVAITDHYFKGLQHGVRTIYWPHGKSIEHYNMGKLHGDIIMYKSDNKTIESTTSFINGKKV